MGHVVLFPRVQKVILPVEVRDHYLQCLSPAKECLCLIISRVKTLNHSKPLWLVINVTKIYKSAASKCLQQANGALTFSKLPVHHDNLVES